MSEKMHFVWDPYLHRPVKHGDYETCVRWMSSRDPQHESGYSLVPACEEHAALYSANGILSDEMGRQLVRALSERMEGGLSYLEIAMGLQRECGHMGVGYLWETFVGPLLDQLEDVAVRQWSAMEGERC